MTGRRMPVPATLRLFPAVEFEIERARGDADEVIDPRTTEPVLTCRRFETPLLVGYMGCGKSTLGRKLARRLGVGFVDTDALVEEQEGASVADVFRYEGEARFPKRSAKRRTGDAAGGETVV